ncbi:CRISPR-associated protein Csx3 [Nostoc sp. 'Peltigera membranacea cyanobiont' 213]|nr:CRISPR-associated protein Csx3 [Nostoc sp. 'Peltigera membranacea cyanobiont' 213]OYD87532.1 CRISPR-associated protein Csx3 [Nostoc sp. 'Peltigera membranacea cyanobiont' 213]
MFSYQIKLEGEVLRVGFNRVLPAQGDQIVRDALEQLEQMIDSGQISGGSRILIDGPQSVPVAYVIAHKLAKLYEVIAVFDPSIGRGKHRYKTYIVTITNSRKYRVGDLIETKEPQQSKSSVIKVVLCGSPNSGKSVLRDGLKRAILSNLNAPYPYVISADSDGGWSHFQEAYEMNEELANSIKTFSKADLTPEFAKEAAQWVRSANQLINIIDVGGKISEENKIIMQSATHAIILSGDSNKFAEWEEFCESIGLKVIAKINSQLNVEQDEVFLVDNWKDKTNELLDKAPLLTGTVHKLQRGENVSTRPIVKALAEVLIHLTQY